MIWVTIDFLSVQTTLVILLWSLLLTKCSSPQILPTPDRFLFCFFLAPFRPNSRESVLSSNPSKISSSWNPQTSPSAYEPCATYWDQRLHHSEVWCEQEGLTLLTGICLIGCSDNCTNVHVYRLYVIYTSWLKTKHHTHICSLKGTISSLFFINEITVALM